ncbi:hypothetical protein CRM22_010239 [Opisthorchis felineus]|uniref:G-protein coupled receptors family 1 profile domain-containing protein n=1 Tax=Opisthorchis felineus TaxID=147828 RepID=A0A4S2L0C1_OPIFE|nr:hypothetical protein CRM22_010239 [Opisthorchis felineus]
MNFTNSHRPALLLDKTLDNRPKFLVNSSSLFLQQFDFIHMRDFLYYYSNTLLSNNYKCVLLTMYILIFILGTFVNIVLVHTIRRLRNPKSLTNRRMLLFRVICDLGLVWFVVPHTAYTAVYHNWQLGTIICKLSAFTMYFFVALNNLILVAICLNRAVAISESGKSPTVPTINVPCRVKCLISVAISVAFLIAFSGCFTKKETKYPLPAPIAAAIEKNPHLRGSHPKVCQDTWSREAQLTFDLVLIFTIYLIPLFVVCVSQHVITVHLKQSQRLLVLMGHQNTVAWTRRRQRLTRLCVLMAALFVLSWTPNHIANLLIGAFKLNNEAMEIFLDFSMLIALSNAVTGPLLLIATCSVYHRYLRHLFACRGICPGSRPGLQTTTVSIRSSLSILSQAVNLAALPGREEHNPQHLEVAPHVIHSVASDFDNTNIE